MHAPVTTPPGSQPWQPQPWQQPPVPPPPRRNTGRAVAIVVIALLVLAGAGIGTYVLTKDRGPAPAAAAESTTSTAPEETEPSAAPEPGVCVEDRSRSADDAEIRSVPCDAPEAVYKVAKTLPEADADCPGSDYTLYYEEGAGGFTMCLMLNAVEGDCFVNLEDIDANVTRVDCAQGEFKVIKVVEGEAAESACPVDDAVVPQVYPEPPPSTVCLEAL